MSGSSNLPQFPVLESAPSKVELLLKVNNQSEVALSIPLDECIAFAHNPLKWLRFLGFSIYGREGYLSEAEGGEAEVDYLEDIQPRRYYFISDGDPRFIDTNVINDRTSQHSRISTSRQEFRANLVQRDGTCVLTGDSEACTACHLIPHSKRDQYLSKLFDHRGEMYGPNVERFHDINDPRNGLLLYNGLHDPLDKGMIAFLKTPNFALQTEDVPYLDSPTSHTPHSPTRLTLQYIKPSKVQSVTRRIAPHNVDARQPDDTSFWPPDIILDLCYAGAALQEWGPKPFKDRLRGMTKSSYYGGGRKRERKRKDDPKGKRKRKAQNIAGPSSRKLRSAGPVEATSNEGSRSEMMDLVMMLWSQSAREGRAQASENRDKNIRRWLQSTES